MDQRDDEDEAERIVRSHRGWYYELGEKEPASNPGGYYYKDQNGRDCHTWDFEESIGELPPIE